MTIFFTRFILPPQTGYVKRDDWDGCWKIYTICTEADSRKSTTNADILILDSADRQAALTSYITLLEKAHTGENFKNLYDQKQCHEAHSFKLNGRPEKIFRIWGTGVIRIYFLYQPDKNIVILKTWPKRKDKLSKGETTELEVIAEQVLGCLQTSNFSSRVIV